MKFKWDDKCQDAFNALKQCLTSPPILKHPTREGKFILTTDASGIGIGAILSQVQGDQEVVISYASKSLSSTQRNYCTTMRELLAVVYFIRYFKHYLWGNKFEIHTDHASLTWIRNFKNPDGMLARWISVLETYNYEISHRKSDQMRHVDALSRVPPRRCKNVGCIDCHEGSLDWWEDSGPQDQKVSPAVQTEQNIVSPNQGRDVVSVNAVTDSPVPGASIPTPANAALETELFSNWFEHGNLEELRDLQNQDRSIQPVLRWKVHNNKPDKETIRMLSPEMKTLVLHWDLLEVCNDILYKRFVSEKGDFLAIVAPETVRKRIFQELHVNRISGHFGRDRTVDLIQRRFYWPNIAESVKRWCETCDMCARCKPGPRIQKSPLKQIRVNQRFQVIALDIFGPLPITNDGNEYILVIGDHFTKWVEAFALPNHTAAVVADRLCTEVICRYGTPLQIHTDQGREFESALFAEVCERLGSLKTRTCPYRPQSDGFVERFNRTLKQMLSLFVSENHDDWDDHLPYLMMAYRATEQDSTKCTPNLLMFRQEITCPIDLMYGLPPDRSNEVCIIEYVEWLKSALKVSFDFANRCLGKAAKRQKSAYDASSQARRLPIGSFVWRYYPPTAKQKLGLGWTGPYLVVQKLSDLVYSVQRNPTSRIINVHVDHLKPYLGEAPLAPWVQTEIEDEERQIPNDDMLNNQGEEFERVNDESTHDVPLSGQNENELSFEENESGTPKGRPVRTRAGRIVKPRVIFSP